MNQTEAAPCCRLIARVWSDEELRMRLLAEPAVVLAEAGISVPKGVSVVVLEDTQEKAHFVIPAKPSRTELYEKDLSKVTWGPSDGGHICIQCKTGESVMVLEDIQEKAHIVIPAKPSSAEFNEQDLSKVIWGPWDGGYECITRNVDE